MCIAELNVASRDCQHRWYHLVRSCSDSTNLDNCTRKLGLEGWEIRCDFCPWCDGWNTDDGSYRIIGGGRTPSTASSHHLSRKPSTSLSSTRRESRSGSLSRTGSNNSITVMSHSVKNRAINARIDSYLNNRPERMQSIDSRLSEFMEEQDDDDDSPTESGSSNNGSQPTGSHAKPSSVFGKSLRKKTKMMGKGFFSFVK
ncbi:hypothetical protein EJ05DRAFT_248854 [Pseudovirgaria hyperparasitica]|uniref:Uncharacterized protein n=1 Tax=Pseudovirgaria hyperparasitica TaxID=470096 RepID=A0A6A6WIJ4_9PEZI|nr:uncharacterized protein EJ05DRAFT_248854 [Pseudovirgaria hyperparasitica]KAF2760991.1 hypothetical protein EJ05DRAFT_248854 [Pseudovirgaria hyperparasitica]